MKFQAALLAASQAWLVSGQTNGTDTPSELPYYGLSPPVYPSPVGNGSSSTQWAAAYAKAKALVAQMTLEEKSNLTRGYTGTCEGMTGTVARLGIPALCFNDAPDGIRGQEFVSAFPAGFHVAATFDEDLMWKYGVALGEEYHARGVNVILGPVAGPMGRMVRSGRAWEGLSGDPHLSGTGMGAITKGIQSQGVIATAKHFLFNEQEFRRTKTSAGEAMSSNVDDRTLHELYAFPFMNSLREGAGAVMCSYNRVNQSYACQNSKLLNGVLKTEFGFEGFVVSDWQAQHTGIASANAGLDIVMPDAGFWGANLTDAVNNGSVSATRLDDMATRVLASIHFLHQEYSYPEPSIYQDSTQKHFAVDASSSDHAELIHQIGAAGTVLVKNVNGTLPFQKPKFLAVYGYDAVNKASPWENPLRFGGGYEVNFGWNTFNGTMITGGGSGSNAPSYVIDPFMAISERIAKDRGTLRWDFWSEAPTPAYVNAEHCLVFINAYASESFDRTTLKDEFSDNLVNNVAKNCSSTVVVIHNAGLRVVDEWIDNPNVTAVIYAGLPGQESGRSIVSILYGDINPSGRLPFTVAKNESDYGSLLNSTISSDYFPSINFTEGLYIDYRAFDREGIEPQFEFGYGLSYTTFGYSDVSTTLVSNETSEYPDASVAIVQGGHPELWDVIAVVKCSVANTGSVDGTEIAQLYITIPVEDTPVRQLRGFKRIGPLSVGEARTAVFELTRRDLSVWDVTAQQWRLAKGEYDFYIGASSRDLRLNGTITIA